MDNRIQGVGVALITPFKSDKSVDFAALERLVDSMVDNGVDYLTALGTTAETPTLNCAEKASVVSCIMERNAGRLPVVLGIGGYNTSEIVEAIRKTDFNGISALLSVTPFYNKPRPEGLFEHYKAIAGESPVPVILYNVPSRTGVNMNADTTLRIAHEIANIGGIKEASGIMGQMGRILKDRPDGFRVISGDDALTLPLYALGGDGVISVAANAFPAQMVAMADAVRRGDYPAAASVHMKLIDAMSALFEEGNPTGVKMAMSVMGLIENELRLPLVSGSDKLRAKLTDIIAAL